MMIDQTTLVIVLLAALAGGIHVFGMDHWLPVSVLAWQKGWRVSRTVIFSFIAFFSHVLTGYILYRVLRGGLIDLSDRTLSLVALVIMFILMLARELRFGKMLNLFRVGHQGVSGSFFALSILGPCEILLPFFIKINALGVNAFVPFIAFLGGTWVVGISLVLMGRRRCNRPIWLPLRLNFAQRQGISIPSVAVFMLTIGFFFFEQG